MAATVPGMTPAPTNEWLDSKFAGRSFVGCSIHSVWKHAPDALHPTPIKQQGGRVKHRITIQLPDKTIRFTAIGNRDALIDAAYDEYGVCGVTVRPA